MDLLDVNAVLASFGEPGTADLDELGAVNLLDLNVVLVSFGLQGDP